MQHFDPYTRRPMNPRAVTCSVPREERRLPSWYHQCRETQPPGRGRWKWKLNGQSTHCRSTHEMLQAPASARAQSIIYAPLRMTHYYYYCCITIIVGLPSIHISTLCARSTGIDVGAVRRMKKYSNRLYRVQSCAMRKYVVHYPPPPPPVPALFSQGIYIASSWISAETNNATAVLIVVLECPNIIAQQQSTYARDASAGGEEYTRQ